MGSKRTLIGLKIFIRLYSVLLIATGLISMAFFYPHAQGFSDCWPYSLCGLVMVILGIGLFFLKDLSRKCMLIFSFGFVAYYVFEGVRLLKNDFTGQGLVGLALLLPIFLICLFGLFFLFSKKVKNKFLDSTSRPKASEELI